MKSFEVNMKRFGKNQPKKKKSKWKNVIILSVLLIIIFVGCAYKVENLIQSSVVKLSVDNDVNATWIGSLASFWGRNFRWYFFWDNCCFWSVLYNSIYKRS